jgi:hypothetical protein
MKINHITISRRADYQKRSGDLREFAAKIAVNSDESYKPSIEISLSEEQLIPIVNIIAEAVAKNMAEAAVAFHQEAIAQLEAKEQRTIEAANVVVDAEPSTHVDDDIPI